MALVSDAGTPLISDPGFKLIRVCIKRNITITAVPGPTSIITALTLSGLPTQPFWYFGYLPEKEGKRKKMLERIKKMFSSHSESDSDREKPALSADRNPVGKSENQRDPSQSLRMTLFPTICFLASPHRLSDELTSIRNVFGDIEIVVARELTKLHEEVYRGKVSDALTHFSNPKGEFVILFQA